MINLFCEAWNKALDEQSESFRKKVAEMCKTEEGKQKFLDGVMNALNMLSENEEE
jgi:hypothetical protein